MYIYIYIYIGLTRLGGAGERGNERGGKGDEEFPEPCDV